MGAINPDFGQTTALPIQMLISNCMGWLSARQVYHWMKTAGTALFPCS
jgi:hypothetical protein